MLNTFKLSNGLQVVTEHIPTTRSVSFGIWVKAGSRNESPASNGITHLIEHMLFKGTSRYSAREIADLFDGLGGNLNAFTSKENTCYYFVVLDQHFPQALAVLANMFFESLFAAEELEKEKKVIFEEIAMYEDTPDDQVHDLIAQAAYADHPLAYPILGTENILQRLQPEDLRNYMQHYYTIDDIVISVAGHFDDSLTELLEEHFGMYNNRFEQRTTVVPTYMPELIHHSKSTEQNHICLAWPGVAYGDTQIFAMNALHHLLGGGMSSRLFQEIREQRGLAYSVYSYHSAYTDSGLFVIYAGTSPDQTNELLEVIIDVMQQLMNQGISAQEIQRTKEQMKGNFILSSESSSSRMHRMGRNQLMLGYQKSIDDVLNGIEAISHQDVVDVAKNMLNQPFALAMVGQQANISSQFRRDQLVTNH